MIKYFKNNIEILVMEYKCLGDIATYINGYPFKPFERGTKGLPIIRIQDLTGNAYDYGFYDGEYPKKVEINNGDVLISWSASIGIYIWNRGKAILNQHIFKVDFDKEKVDKQYYFYAVQYKLNEMKLKAHGATMKHIIKSDFEKTVIPFPQLNIQQAVSFRLKKVEKIIDNYANIIKQLDDLIQARFVEMFESKFPLVKLGDVIKTTSGGTPLKSHKEYYENGTIPWLTSGEVNAGVITKVKNFITEEGLKNSSAKIVPRDTVVIAMYGATAGVTGILRLDATTNQAVCSLLPSDRFIPEFLYYAVSAKKKWLISQSKGGGQKNISQEIIKDMNLFDAPKDEQIKFSDFAKQIDKLKSKVQKSLDETQLLFDSLMQKYFS